MPDTGAPWNLPFPSLADPADGPDGIRDLAEAVAVVLRDPVVVTVVGVTAGAPAFQNGWAAVFSVYYYMDGPRLWLGGSAIRGAGPNALAIFTLPAPVRPAHDKVFASPNGSGGYTDLVVQSTGVVRLGTAGGTAQFDGISFDPAT